MIEFLCGRTALLPISLLLISSVMLLIIPHPLILVILPLCVLAAWLAIRFPFLICLAFIVFSFFRIHEAFPVLLPLRIPQLLALGSLAVLGWHLFIAKSMSVYWSSNLTLFMVFFVLVTVGALLATDRASAIAAITGSYSKIMVMVFAIAWLTRSADDFNKAGLIFAVAGVLIAVVAVFNKLNGIGLVEGTRVTIGRDIGSMIGDPNDLSLVLTFPLSFALSFIVTPGYARWRKLFFILSYLCIAWAIVATQSRGGLLGMVAVTGITAWRLSKNKVLIIILGILGMSLLLALAGISDRASGGAAEEGIDESAMGRIYAWEAALRMALARPLNGVGIDNFYANYFFFSSHWDGKNHAVHSTWFQIIAETGFLGFIIFTLLVKRTFGIMLASLRFIDTNSASIPPSVKMAGQALFSGLVGFCVSGTFLTQGFIWPFYILFALAIALERYLQQSKPHNPISHLKTDGVKDDKTRNFNCDP